MFSLLGLLMFIRVWFVSRTQTALARWRDEWIVFKKHWHLSQRRWRGGCFLKGCLRNNCTINRWSSRERRGWRQLGRRRWPCTMCRRRLLRHFWRRRGWRGRGRQSTMMYRRRLLAHFRWTLFGSFYIFIFLRFSLGGRCRAVWIFTFCGPLSLRCGAGAMAASLPFLALFK